MTSSQDRPFASGGVVPGPAQWAGETAETVAEEYGLTRAELLLAAWFSARHGPIHPRRRWRKWLKRWEPVVWRGGYDPAGVPLPTEVDHV